MHATFKTSHDDARTIVPHAAAMAALNPPPCPECGAQMRLATIEPQVTEKGSDMSSDKPLEAISYRCTCGATDTRIVETD